MRAFADVSYDISRCWGNDQPATFWAGPDFVTTLCPGNGCSHPAERRDSLYFCGLVINVRNPGIANKAIPGLTFRGMAAVSYLAVCR